MDGHRLSSRDRQADSTIDSGTSGAANSGAASQGTGAADSAAQSQ